MIRLLKTFTILIFILINSIGFSEDVKWENYKSEIIKNLKTIPGWCSSEKANQMMDLIYEIKPEVCVEIGVFGGASILPTAKALQYLNKGKVYAIDPWDTYEAIKYFTIGDPNYNWWKSIDMKSIYLGFCRLLFIHDLKDYCHVIKSTSELAASKIKTIDILHIDGNHCDESAYIDVITYVPKVKINGYIWFDGWATAPIAFEYIKKTCYVKKVIDNGGCILLKKAIKDKL